MTNAIAEKQLKPFCNMHLLKLRSGCIWFFSSEMYGKISLKSSGATDFVNLKIPKFVGDFSTPALDFAPQLF